MDTNLIPMALPKSPHLAGDLNSILHPPMRADWIGSPDPDAIYLGRVIDPELGFSERMFYGGEQGVLIFGPNGKGKGTRLLIPNLLENRGASMVVVDPKGELAAITAPYRRALGRVVIINPFGVLADLPGYGDLRSQGYNPLASLTPDSPNFDAEIAQIGEALVPIEGKDPHWTQSGRALFSALTMHAAFEARRTGRVPTMKRVRELLCQPSDPPHAGNGHEGIGLPVLMRGLAESDYPALANKASQFAVWTNEINSIVSTAQIQTEPFDDRAIAQDMAGEAFDFGIMKKEPTTVYIVLPPEALERHSKWLRLLLTRAIQGVLRHRSPGELKTIFMLDEFHALGHLQIIETVFALVRGYGVQLMPVLQSLGQLSHHYGDLTESILDSTGAMASYAPSDFKTAEWLSKRAGETTRDVRTMNQSVAEASNWGSNQGTNPGGTSRGSSSGGSFSSTISTNYSQVRAPLITPHRLFGLGAGEMLVSLDGVKDLTPAYAPPYFDVRRQWLCARDNPYHRERRR